MKPERLQEIADPLDSFLLSEDFSMTEAPIVDGAVRKVSFSDSDGIRKIRYMLKVIVDEDKGPYRSKSEIELEVDLFDGDEKAIPLNAFLDVSMNMPAPDTVRDIIEEQVRPNLFVILHPDS